MYKPPPPKGQKTTSLQHPGNKASMTVESRRKTVIALKLLGRDRILFHFTDVNLVKKFKL